MRAITALFFFVNQKNSAITNHPSRINFIQIIEIPVVKKYHEYHSVCSTTSNLGTLMKCSLLKRTDFYLAIIVALLAGIGLWKTFNPFRKTTKILFKTCKPTHQPIAQYVSASGTLKAREQILIGSLVAGKIHKLLVDTNDIVKKDQVLVELDNGIGDSFLKKIQGQLDEAKAKALFAQQTYVRQKKIYDSGQLSQQDFDKIVHDVAVTQAQVSQNTYALEQEQKQYKNLFITSPDDGIIITKNVNLGQMITSQLDAKVLFEIAKDLTDMEADVDVDEADVGLVKVGQEAFISVDAFPQKSFSSTIARIEYQVKTTENVKSYNTIINLKNPEKILRPGMTANVSIKIADNKNALALPNKAFRLNSKTLAHYAKETGYLLKKLGQVQGATVYPDTVWVLGTKVIKQIPVTLGANNEKYTEIKEGIAQDAQVIIECIEPKKSSQFLKGIFSGR